MSNIKYFSATNSSPHEPMNLFLLNKTSEEVFRWSIYLNCWEPTSLEPLQLYDDKGPKIIELDVNSRYNFRNEELIAKWNEIVLRNSQLGREIL